MIKGGAPGICRVPIGICAFDRPDDLDCFCRGLSRLGFGDMRWAEAGRVALLAPGEALEPLIARIEAEQANPDRIATAADVAALWLMLLDRRAVPAAVLARHADRSTIRDLRRTIVRMPEFRRRTAP